MREVLPELEVRARASVLFPELRYRDPTKTGPSETVSFVLDDVGSWKLGNMDLFLSKHATLQSQLDATYVCAGLAHRMENRKVVRGGLLYVCGSALSKDPGAEESVASDARGCGRRPGQAPR